jgi:thiosulfate/3-mercaptopyruvate sulfurtransferase
MAKSRRFVAVAACLAACVAAPLAGAAEKAPALVSTRWLAEHLDDPGLVVLHVAMLHEGAPRQLIPGARVLDYHAITVERDGLPVEMPQVADLAKVFQAAGVSNDKQVILYGEGWPHTAARAFVTLDYLGHGERTSLLDGGLEAWRADGHRVVSQPAAGEPGTFTPRPREDVLVSADWIAGRLKDPALTLIDARTAAEYTGERKQGELRGGHIPGAYHLYYQDLLVSQENPRLKDLGYVKDRFAEAGASKGGPVVSYCYIGMRASYTYVVSRHLGYDAKLYDPSWAEWGRREDLPLTAGQSRR